MDEITLGIGLYSCKTGDYNRIVRYIKKNPDLDINHIITQVKKQLEIFESRIKGKVPNFGVRGVFVCPEYLFSAGDGQIGKRGVRDYIKNRIVKKLIALSKEHSNIIVIPGSIAWETSVLGSGIANISAGGSLRIEDIRKPIPVITAKKHWQNSQVSGSGRVGDYKDVGLKKLDKLKKSKMSGASKKIALQNNTVVLLHNGRVIGEYNKASDYCESRISHTYHVPYPYPGTFEVKTHKGKLTIGLEVCLDHNIDTLGKWIGGSNARKPHLHVVCSACVKPNKVWAKKDGWYLHSSSEPSYTCIADSKGAIKSNLKSSENLLIDIVKVPLS
ncbi:MAG: hypothetical protein KAQ62_02165 [Cyclobacteriaceae bacterium]|nr:hypothetical protein [Cyclobacteriaceae bacterium]MCK5367317.1 hypothetical protein [Cyclobacteriaceae bacterium]MCK5467225.1 hypothetical protein [Cyclobacteriaceae bacterium]